MAATGTSARVLVVAASTKERWTRSIGLTLRARGLQVERAALRELPAALPEAALRALSLVFGLETDAEPVFSAIESIRRSATRAPIALVTSGRLVDARDIGRANWLDVQLVPYACSYFRRNVLAFAERAIVAGRDATETHAARVSASCAKGRLSPRECQVCELRTSGRRNVQIARMLAVEVSTIEELLKRARRKLGLRPGEKLEVALLGG